MRSIAIISIQAFSLVNFRGPLIRALTDRGVCVYALAPDFDNELRTRVSQLGAEPVDFSLSRTGMNPLKDAADIYRLSQLLRRLAPGMTLNGYIKPIIYGSIAAWLARVPKRFSLFEGAGYVFLDAPESRTWQRCLLRWAVKRLYKVAFGLNYKVFFLNPDDVTYFVGEGVVAVDKVARIDGIGLDLDYFTPAPLVLQPITFIMVARMLKEKGVYDFVEAVRQVRKRNPEVRFMLIGGTDINPGSIMEAELRAWVSEGLVEWPGQVNDVRPWLAQASVFVLPSYYSEGLPRSSQEAMAMGLPVITTDWVGCRETVQDGVNGFLVPVRDPAALAQAMMRFVESPDLIATMGREGRRITEERFNVHIINQRIMEVIGIAPPVERVDVSCLTPMKIVMLSGDSYSLINFRGHLLREMVRQGHEVIACAPSIKNSVLEALSGIDVRFIPLPFDRTGMNPLADLTMLVRIWRILFRLHPDLLLSYTLKSVIYGSLAGRLAGVKAIFSIISGMGYSYQYITHRKWIIRQVMCMIYRIALHSNRLIFFQNPDDRALFIKEKLVRNKNVTGLTNGSGVDLDYFAPCPLPKIKAPVFLLVGRMLADKGVRDFVEASKYLKQHYPACRFRLLGPIDSGPLACNPDEISAWQEEGFVEYCGTTDDVRPYLAEATVFVLPSYYREGIPRSALEALSMGRAVVTTDAPGCREVVRHGENGLLVPIKDIAALTAAMERFIIEPDLAERMGLVSRRMAEERFDVHQVNQQLMKAMALI